MRKRINDWVGEIAYYLVMGIVILGLPLVFSTTVYYFINSGKVSSLRYDKDGVYSVLIQEGEQTLRVKTVRRCGHEK